MPQEWLKKRQKAKKIKKKNHVSKVNSEPHILENGLGKVTDCQFFSLWNMTASVLPFFFGCPKAYGVLGPGISSEPQSQPKPQLWQRGIGNQTCNPALPSRHHPISPQRELLGCLCK